MPCSWASVHMISVATEPPRWVCSSASPLSGISPSLTVEPFGTDMNGRPIETPEGSQSPMTTSVPIGSDVSSGTYRCTNCGNEVSVQSVQSLVGSPFSQWIFSLPPSRRLGETRKADGRVPRRLRFRRVSNGQHDEPLAERLIASLEQERCLADLVGLLEAGTPDEPPRLHASDPHRRAPDEDAAAVLDRDDHAKPLRPPHVLDDVTDFCDPEPHRVRRRGRVGCRTRLTGRPAEDLSREELVGAVAVRRAQAD